MTLTAKATLRLYMEREVEIELPDDFDGDVERYIAELHSCGDLPSKDSDWSYTGLDVNDIVVTGWSNLLPITVTVEEAYEQRLWEAKTLLYQFPNATEKVMNIQHFPLSVGWFSITTEKWLMSATGTTRLTIEEE